MPTYSEFFLNSSRAIIRLETLEISHPNFSRVYRLVRNHRQGIYAKIENGKLKNFYYAPLKITKGKSSSDLDSSLNISFGDLGQIIPKELDLIENNDNYGVAPTVIYRTYRSDDLNNILEGPYYYEISATSQDQQGVTFEAKAPGLNNIKTGELYRLDRFPMLRGFI